MDPDRSGPWRRKLTVASDEPIAWERVRSGDELAPPITLVHSALGRLARRALFSLPTFDRHNSARSAMDRTDLV